MNLNPAVSANRRAVRGRLGHFLSVGVLGVLFSAGVLTAAPCLAEPEGLRLNCRAGYGTLLKELKDRQDLQMQDYPFGIEFQKKGTGTVAYYFTKPVHGAHPAIFWYGGKGACKAVKADGCGFGATEKFKAALEKYRARGSNGCP